MPQVTLKQATIDYHVLGPDDSPHPPVLFVHGILVDHRLWHEVAEQLADKGFRCVLPDWPLGSHRIPVNAGADLSPRGVATMIRDFIVALDLSDVTLVGNDTGGGLCQLVIDAHPEHVGRLVLTNCDAFDTFRRSRSTPYSRCCAGRSRSGRCLRRCGSPPCVTLHLDLGYSSAIRIRC